MPITGVSYPTPEFKHEVTRDPDGTLRIDGEEWTGENLKNLRIDAERMRDEIAQLTFDLADLDAVIAFLGAENG